MLLNSMVAGYTRTDGEILGDNGVIFLEFVHGTNMNA